MNTSQYDENLLVKHQKEVDQADDQALELLSLQAEIFGNAIGDKQFMIDLEDYLLYDDGLAADYQAAIHAALSGQGNVLLLDCFEEAALKKAKQLINNTATVDTLFTTLHKSLNK